MSAGATRPSWPRTERPSLAQFFASTKAQRTRLREALSSLPRSRMKIPGEASAEIPSARGAGGPTRIPPGKKEVVGTARILT